MFSILIPTYNNLDYLKTCIDSIKKNSNLESEIKDGLKIINKKILPEYLFHFIKSKEFS